MQRAGRALGRRRGSRSLSRRGARRPRRSWRSPEWTLGRPAEPVSERRTAWPRAWWPARPRALTLAQQPAYVTW